MATYQADGKIIRKLPVATKVEGGTSFTLGFPVCTLSEYVEDQGEAVAELLTRGEGYEKMQAALNECVGVLDMLTMPDSIETTSLLHVYAACLQASSHARAALILPSN